jgi:hypothetical protein
MRQQEPGARQRVAAVRESTSSSRRACGELARKIREIPGVEAKPGRQTRFAWVKRMSLGSLFGFLIAYRINVRRQVRHHEVAGFANL